MRLTLERLLKALDVSKPLPGLLGRIGACLLSIILFSDYALAATADNDIYQSALKVIITKEQPQKFVIWRERIGPEAMSVKRVPRQTPDNQFVRLLGVTKNAQQNLLSLRDERDESRIIGGLPASEYGTSFAGAVDVSAIELAEIENKPPVLVIGFSRVAYSNSGSTALLYSEVCLTGSYVACSAEGYVFQKGSSGWKVQRQADIWDGADQPFWKFRPL